MLGGTFKFKDVVGKDLEIAIPAGTQPGAKVYFQGGGVKGVLSRTSGDLILHVEINIPANVSPRAKKLLEALCDELEKPQNGP